MSSKVKVFNLLNLKIESLNFFLVFKFINLTKDLNHSANKICRNEEGRIFAIRCNCGKGIYHPIAGDKTYWNHKIPAKNISALKRLTIEKLFWILQD